MSDDTNPFADIKPYVVRCRDAVKAYRPDEAKRIADEIDAEAKKRELPDDVWLQRELIRRYHDGI